MSATMLLMPLSGEVGIPELSRWRDVFKGRARFAVFTHQEWVRWVQEHDTAGTWSDWLGHVRS